MDSGRCIEADVLLLDSEFSRTITDLDKASAESWPFQGFDSMFCLVSAGVSLKTAG
jgi:hypothetical protein